MLLKAINLIHHQITVISFKYCQTLYTLLDSLICEIVLIKNEIEIKTTLKNLETVLFLLKYNTISHFEQLVDIVVQDHPQQGARFKISYILVSLLNNKRIIVSVYLTEKDFVNSIGYIYNSASWLEREAWDMFGVDFIGNSAMRRLLTDYGFTGHPLLKDFPTTGFVQCTYDEDEKLVLFSTIALPQEYRNFKLSTI